MAQTLELVIQPEDAGQRVDSFVSRKSGLSRNYVQQLIDDKHITVNDKRTMKSQKLEVGDRLYVEVPPPADTDIIPQDIPLDVVYEDAHLLVVNKPKGMVVHPAAGNWDGTLVNAVMHHCGGTLSGIGGEIRPGIVHRIDKDTSGLLVVAKDDDTHKGLAAQFAVHSIDRTYEAIVYGRMPERGGQVDMPIGRSQADRKKMSVAAHHTKEATTFYHVVAEYPAFSHLRLRLKTGRTHQIRVHMAALGHPVAGDPVYGPKKVIKKLGGQCLHAGELGFVHPATGERLLFSSPLPVYFTDFIGTLGTADDMEEETHE